MFKAIEIILSFERRWPSGLLLWGAGRSEYPNKHYNLKEEKAGLGPEEREESSHAPERRLHVKYISGGCKPRHSNERAYMIEPQRGIVRLTDWPVESNFALAAVAGYNLHEK